VTLSVYVGYRDFLSACVAGLYRKVYQSEGAQISWEPPKSSRHQNGDLKGTPYRGFTSISRCDCLVPGIYVPQYQSLVSIRLTVRLCGVPDR